MNLEDICVSLETAKKLVEAGIEIDSNFCWFIYEEYRNQKPEILPRENIEYPERRIKYPAPTTDEFDMLDVIVHEGVVYSLRISRGVNAWVANYIDRYEDHAPLVDYDKLDPYPFNDHKLSEVFASVRIWLKEKGYYNAIPS